MALDKAIAAVRAEEDRYRGIEYSIRIKANRWDYSKDVPVPFLIGNLANLQVPPSPVSEFWLPCGVAPVV